MKFIGIFKNDVFDSRDILADGTALDSHISATSAHGITGDIVGTSDTQTLTNKTINTANNNLVIDTADVTSGTFANARIHIVCYKSHCIVSKTDGPFLLLIGIHCSRLSFVAPLLPHSVFCFTPFLSHSELMFFFFL